MYDITYFLIIVRKYPSMNTCAHSKSITGNDMNSSYELFSFLGYNDEVAVLIVKKIFTFKQIILPHR